MMGWWKPYFFTETEGVQLLFEWAQIEGTQTFVLASAVVAILSLLDRWAAHYSIHLLRQQSVYRSTVIWTLERFASGLLMLVMMSFNAILFLQVVIFSGVAELVMRIYWTKDDEIAFQTLAQSQVELTECC